MGVRKIAEQFNRDPETKKEGKSVSSSHTHNILTKEGMTPKGKKSENNEKKKSEKKKLHRRTIPFREFQMDTKRQVLAGGLEIYFIAIIDIFSSDPVLVLISERKNGHMVREALKELRIIIPKARIIIKMDNGKEFDNGKVRRYCKNNGIKIKWNEKGKPWQNGFVERWFRTLKYEYINLVFLKTSEEARELTKQIISHFTLERVHQGLDYQTPAEKMEDWLIEMDDSDARKKALKTLILAIFRTRYELIDFQSFYE